MKNLNIGTKLTIAFAALTAVMVVVLMLAFVGMKQVDRRFDEVMKRDFFRVETTNHIIRNVDAIFHSIAVGLMAKDQGVIDEWAHKIGDSRQEQGRLLAALDKLETGRAKELLTEYKGALAKGKAGNDRIAELLKAGQRDEAVGLYIGDSLPNAMKNRSTLEALEHEQVKDMRAAHEAALKESATYRLLLVVLGLVTVACAAAATYILKRGITAPLAESVRIADRLARGELDVQVRAGGSDEVGRLLGSLKNMVERWREVVGRITETASSLSFSAMGLAASAEQVSKGSAKQAERTAVVSASSDEMSRSVFDVARNAGEISKAASDAATMARDGESVVNRAVEEVRQIASTVGDSSRFVHSLGERSKQIGEIVGVINDIADQTNLLALNAAIEAARAGDQGRGFAVVADEVRKLAERTASSTSEIGTMIKGIRDEVDRAVQVMADATSKVDNGVRLSEEAGGALGSIVRSVDGLQAILQQIASATEEMSAASGEITKEMEQIATISAETSSGSEQAAKASGDLAVLSATLQDVVKEFRL